MGYGRLRTVGARSSMVSDSVFQHYIPQEPLGQFVGLFWHWQGYDLQQGRERCLPSGTTELVISLRDDHKATAVVSGARASSFILERTSADCLFGIHFKAGGAFPFLPLPACELEQAEISFDDLWPGEAVRLRERLLERDTVSGRFSVVEEWLLSKLAANLEHHRAVKYALGKLAEPDEIAMAQMADEVNLSQRRFIEIFKKQVGLTPKLFRRVMRFQNILAAVSPLEDVDWLDIALAQGYYDQAHFNHDFKEFSGLTPNEYLDRRTAYLNHVRI